MSNVFTLLLAREARLLFRRPAELANPLVFFAIVMFIGWLVKGKTPAPAPVKAKKHN